MEDEAAKKNEGKLRKAIRTIVAEALSKATEDKIRKKAKEISTNIDIKYDDY